MRSVYEQYSMGVYVKDIIVDLTAKGAYNKGKPFAKNTVYNILRNEKYSGVYRYKDEVFTNIYPQIVPTEVFCKVRKKIAQNKNGKASVMTRYLLKNKLFCGYCGTKMVGVGGTSKTGDVKHYYRCRGIIDGEPCRQRLFRQDILDKLVVDSIVSELSKPNTIEYIVGNLLKVQNELVKANPNVATLQKQKHNVERALENIMKGIELGIMNNTTAKRMQELESQLANIEKQLIIERSKTDTQLSSEQIYKFYSDALRLEAPLLVELLVDKVTLYDEKIVIQYKTPLSVDPDDMSGFLICRHPLRSNNCAKRLYNNCNQIMIEMKI